MIEEKIAHLVERKCEEPEFADCFLLEVKVRPNNKVEVFLDSDQGITFEKCRLVSRYLEEHIEKEGWLGEKYTLEVSSPGATRPMSLPRQFPKHQGRVLKIRLHEGEEVKGKLLEANPDALELEITRTVREGKKKKRVKETREIKFDQIEKATVQLSF